VDLASLCRAIFTSRARPAPPGAGPPHVGHGPLEWCDRVRVRSAPATEAIGIAGRVGQIYGETTPSSTNVKVVGEHARDYAISLHFTDPNFDVWIAEELVEFVDHGAGTTMTVGDKALVRRADGEWEPAPR
jgi:hypothetical protein